MEPGLLDKWIAYRRLEPELGELLRRLTETIKLGISAICAAQGFEVTPDQFDFTPPDEQTEKPDASEMSPAQGAAMMATHLGAADRT